MWVGSPLLRQGYGGREIPDYHIIFPVLPCEVLTKHGSVAQLAEQSALNRKRVGSNPTRPTTTSLKLRSASTT